MSGLEFLQDWYLAQTDGDWEHGFGITIETLDNPGWFVRVSLEETALEGRTFEYRAWEKSDDDWHHTWSDGVRFEGAGGPKNLSDLLREFRRFVESMS